MFSRNNTNTCCVQLQRIDFFQQVVFFSDVRQQLAARLGAQQASVLVSRALFLVCLGNNDYLTGYFGNPVGLSPMQRKYSPDQFRSLLISIFEQNLLVGCLYFMLRLVWNFRVFTHFRSGAMEFQVRLHTPPLSTHFG